MPFGFNHAGTLEPPISPNVGGIAMEDWAEAQLSLSVDERNEVLTKIVRNFIFRAMGVHIAAM